MSIRRGFQQWEESMEEGDDKWGHMLVSGERIVSRSFATYSLCPKKQVTLEFKIYPKKLSYLPYLESVCACKN